MISEIGSYGGATLPPHHGGAAKIMGGEACFRDFTPPLWGGNTQISPHHGGETCPPIRGGAEGSNFALPWGGKHEMLPPLWGGFTPPIQPPINSQNRDYGGSDFWITPPHYGGEDILWTELYD